VEDNDAVEGYIKRQKEKQAIQGVEDSMLWISKKGVA